MHHRGGGGAQTRNACSTPGAVRSLGAVDLRPCQLGPMSGSL